jgi:Meiotically up-regulated gene 113
MEKEQILAEIQRTAATNGGRALGKSRFAAETGIRETNWRGRYWARWSDALAEAGFGPNEYQSAIPEQTLLASLADEILRSGKMPTSAELALRRRVDSEFPSPKVFDRLGPKAGWARRVADAFPERQDVRAILAPLLAEEATNDEPVDGGVGQRPDGFVYLLRSGRHYKIGYTFDVGRRRYDLAIQLPEAVEEVHAIRTDDPVGIERYWHERFSSRRKNGEWFDLTRDDITAFKRRKFM